MARPELTCQIFHTENNDNNTNRKLINLYSIWLEGAVPGSEHTAINSSLIPLCTLVGGTVGGQRGNSRETDGEVWYSSHVVLAR